MILRMVRLGSNPWIMSVLALAGLALTVLVLLRLGQASLQELRGTAVPPNCDQDLSPTDSTCMIEQFLVSQRYFVWVAALSISLVTWVAIFLTGIATHYRKGCHRGFALSLYVGVAIFTIAAWFLIQLANENLTLVRIDNHPIPWWPEWRSRITFFGIVAASPWIARIWEVTFWAQRCSRRPTIRVREVRWRRIEHSISVLVSMIFLAVAVAFLLRYAVTAERSEFQGTFVKASDYPGYAVGLNGLLFSVVLFVACLPLAIAWRRLSHLRSNAAPTRSSNT